MIDREIILPLLIGLVVALLLHLTLVPAATVRLLAQSLEYDEIRSIERDEPESDPPPEPDESKSEDQELQPHKPKIRLGKDDAPQRVTVSWISHDDFQQLMAGAKSTVQPALQDKVNPAPEAPARVHATDPVQPSAEQPVSLPEPSTVTASESPVSPPRPQIQPPPDPIAFEEESLVQIPAQAPIKDGNPTTQVLAAPPLATTVTNAPEKVTAPEHDSEMITAKNQFDAASSRIAEIPPKQQKPAVQPPAMSNSIATPLSSRSKIATSVPTVSARSDRQSIPTTRVDLRKRQLGKVEVGRGLELRTVVPKISVLTRLSGIPSNAKVTLVFNKSGHVIRAHLDRSTGYMGYDSAILEALYKWQTKGKQLQEHAGDLTIPIDIILN